MSSQEIEKLVKKTKNLVLSVIQKYADDLAKPYIDDIFQDVYVRLLLSLGSDKFRNKSKITTYLYQIAKNETLRYNEKLKKERQKKEKLKEFWKSKNFISEKTEISITKEQFLNKKYLNSLQRNILNLYLNGFSLKEIAKQLNQKEGTIKSNLFRIKAKIQKFEKG
ncbi:MAG: sigma-70 family RNA polymerase sigma factor [Leptospiraceae bacterium]|nr:sigma-70 family RNA polymerase sigma factor [Leptospiraceae bacterium]MDW7976223.1 sigma-70 family RNA polymerase sigma factor [Leptospiraceae bacterium]